MTARCDFRDIFEIIYESCPMIDCPNCPCLTNCFFLFRTDVEQLTIYKEGE